MRARIGLLTLLLCLLVFPVYAQTGSGSQAIIIAPPVVDNSSGTISVRFIVQENGVTVRDVTPASIQISEPAADLQLAATAERPLTLAILVDLSFGSDADLVRDTLRAFFDSYYTAGDQVTLYVLDAASASSSAVQVIPITSHDEALAALNGLTASERLYVMQDALALAYNDLTALPDDPLMSRQVLFVGSLLNRPDDASETARFADSGILVHGVQAHRTRETQTTTFRGLANNGGGLFANNYNGIFVIPGDVYQPINNLKVLYDTIASSRLVYTLTYRTASQSLDANRPVTLGITLPSGSIVETTYQYQWEFQPPQVVFTSARDFAVGRTPFLREDGTIGFEPQVRQIPVQVTFPDGVQRRIESARLEVLDSSNNTVLQSELALQPVADASGTILLNWALDDYGVQGSTRNLLIQVTVTDELGISGSAAVDGSVQVSVLPPTPTPIPTITPIPTAAPEIAVTAAATTAAAPANAVLSNDVNLVLVAANAILALLVIVLLVRVIRARNRAPETAPQAQPMAEPAAAARGMRTWPSDRLEPQVVEEKSAPASNGSQKAVCKLVLKEGMEQLGFHEVVVDAPEFIIGRVPECNLVIDQPTVSNRHCALRVDPERGIFVRDLGSVNGTYINGDRLHSGEEAFVPLGSELWVTKAHIFELWDAEKQIQFTKDEEQAKLSTLFISPDAVVFKPLPGLRYAPDDGGPIDDEYAPI